MKKAIPKVSVCIFAYNFEKYISKAIESVLMQKTNFNFDIIIGEDKSTDKTSEICLSYQNKYPDRICVLSRHQNLGMIKNVFDTLKVATGEYIALLDADDYWIDPLKLQKQVDFMEKNLEFSLCCHNSLILYEDHDISPSLFNPKCQNKIISLENIVMNWSMATATILFRSSMMSYPELVYKAHNFDIAIQFLLADRGKVGYLNEPMSVYRKNLKSNSFNPEYTLDFVYDRQYELFSYLKAHFDPKYNSILKKKLQNILKEKKAYLRIKKYPIIKYLNFKKVLIKLLS
jgi:glycosyltransferase involved in cell wall biosynthesis